MVRNEIWIAARPPSLAQQLTLFDMGEPAVVAYLDLGVTPYGTYLCIGCLERRISRRLTRADFSDASVNALDDDHPLRSRRLLDRLSSP
jgi:hypothetical protein